MSPVRQNSREKPGNEKLAADVESNPLANSNNEVSIEAAAERRLVMKLDILIYPIFYIVYMMSFLDRINISNARIQGMISDLNLTGNRFNIALFVSFSPSTSLVTTIANDQTGLLRPLYPSRSSEQYGYPSCATILVFQRPHVLLGYH